MQIPYVVVANDDTSIEASQMRLFIDLFLFAGYPYEWVKEQMEILEKIKCRGDDANGKKKS
ncbi:MAG: hypothetical protein J7L47_04990 [Candidatus Odinarchaeota archaeon]|nr:hypothetical protein [Candidatus Odinarchaeota archaeon]